MGYTIIQTLLDKYNRPRTPLKPQGIVIHDTEGHEDTDEGNYSYFNGANRSASAHYFVDWDSISQFIPDNEEAWHAGYNANIRYLSMELTHTTDAAKFAEIWKRGVWLVASKCIQYGWSPTNTGEVLTHHMVSDKWHETTHTDPDEYFKLHGKTFADFVADVQAEILALHHPEPNPAAEAFGVVKVLCSTLNVRVQPTTSAALSRAPIKQGEEYKYYSKQNGWYCLGSSGGKDMWAYGNNGAYLQDTPATVAAPKPPSPAPTPSPTPAKIPVAATAPAAPSTPAPVQVEKATPYGAKVDFLIHRVGGDKLGELQTYIAAKGWWYQATRNATDDSQDIEVGIFIIGNAPYTAFKDFLDSENFSYSLIQK